MQVFLLYLLSQLMVFGDLAGDPIHEASQGRQALRQFECERMSQAEAHQKYPGRVPATSARGSALFQIDALVCERLLVQQGARSPRDEAVLQRLDDEVAALGALAMAAVSEDTRWVVDAFYPSAPMVRKIAAATRTSLAQRGLKVSDLPPLLTAGDVEVFRSFPMREAIPLACKRLYQLNELDDDQAFLAVALLHEKETQLHAGVCKQGVFRWLR